MKKKKVEIKSNMKCCKSFIYYLNKLSNVILYGISFNIQTDLHKRFQNEQPVREIDLFSICLARDVTDLIRTQQTPLT